MKRPDVIYRRKRERERIDTETLKEIESPQGIVTPGSDVSSDSERGQDRDREIVRNDIYRGRVREREKKERGRESA